VKISWSELKIEPGRAIATIGMFDGVHRGHRALLGHVASHAKKSGGESVAITFDPHPRLVLSPGESGIRFLSTPGEKISLLEECGIDHLLIIPFTDEMSRMSACSFTEKYLVDMLGVKHLYVGYNHRFGHRGEGEDANTSLSECVTAYGLGHTRIDAFMSESEAVSSSLIRKYLEEGALARANQLLGYSYLLHGRVVEGERIGRLLGYPTANIESEYEWKLIPADGVYAAHTSVEGREYPSMLYIGTRPTIEPQGERSVEVNLIGFSGNLYGMEMKVRLRHRIRGDIRFDTREELRDRISLDREETLRLLG
jgi:riboflavin kinase/FMN adenylyltransferase